jgi:hypothetical protein
MVRAHPNVKVESFLPQARRCLSVHASRDLVWSRLRLPASFFSFGERVASTFVKSNITTERSAKMFFVKDEERIITLHPSFFGPHVKKYLLDKLLNDVEGAHQPILKD